MRESARKNSASVGAPSKPATPTTCPGERRGGEEKDKSEERRRRRRRRKRRRRGAILRRGDVRRETRRRRGHARREWKNTKCNWSEEQRQARVGVVIIIVQNRTRTQTTQALAHVAFTACGIFHCETLPRSRPGRISRAKTIQESEKRQKPEDEGVGSRSGGENKVERRTVEKIETVGRDEF